VGDDRYVPSFKAGFTMVPRKAFTEWVGYYPEIFFRAAAETYLSTALWDSGRPVKCLTNARMYHAQAMQGRSDRDWKFYGIRSQALCAIMREPWFIVPFSLLSKFFKSLINCARWGHLGTWLKAWCSTAFHCSEALRWRRPISFVTYKRLYRLRQGVITKREQLG
jgi:GT2 family glycosyltransferase